MAATDFTTKLLTKWLHCMMPCRNRHPLLSFHIDALGMPKSFVFSLSI